MDSALLALYLRYLFPSRKGETVSVVSTLHPLGRLMVVFAKVSEKPVPPGGEIVVDLELPGHHDATKRLENHWLYYDAGGTESLNMAVRAYFDIEFAGYYRKGESMGLRKKDIIDAFIFSRNLMPECFDALHKRVYRKEQKTMEQLRRQLVRRAYYLDETIDYKGIEK